MDTEPARFTGQLHAPSSRNSPTSTAFFSILQAAESSRQHPILPFYPHSFHPLSLNHKHPPSLPSQPPTPASKPPYQPPLSSASTLPHGYSREYSSSSASSRSTLSSRQTRQTRRRPLSQFLQRRLGTVHRFSRTCCVFQVYLDGLFRRWVEEGV